MRSFAIATLLILTCSAAVFAAEWDGETLLAQEVPFGFDISPDGRQVVWVKRSFTDDGQDYQRQLMLSSLGKDDTPAEPRQLTRHEADSRNPGWSPDGSLVAFMGARDGESGQQIWLLDMTGGEPRQVGMINGGVFGYDWLDNERLLILAGEGETLRETQLKENSDDTMVVGDEEHEAPIRLFSLDVGTGQARRLTDNTRPIIDFTVSGDGKHAVYQLSDDFHFDYDMRHPPRVMLLDIETGESKEILKPEMLPGPFAWDLKNEGFYFNLPEGSDPDNLMVSIAKLGYFELKSGHWWKVNLEWERGLDEYSALLPTKKGVLVTLVDGVSNRLLHLERKGDHWKRHVVPTPVRGFTELLDLGPDGETLIWNHSTASSPPVYNVARLDKGKLKETREFLKINTFLDDLTMPRCDVIRWVGARGDTVEGLLHYPLDYREGERQPLMVMIHGGPADRDADYFMEGWGGSPGLFAARGAFVLRPNYHGSTAYGLEWMESIKGRYYELEIPDILAGVDHLVELGLVDQSRLGVQGWSNGAILGIALCIESGQRFRALDAGAGDVNWSSDLGNCAFGAAFHSAYVDSRPWEDPYLYVNLSPIFRIDQLRVPTLISFGAEDVIVPTEQGWQLYRALQDIGETPVRFVIYPGEGHSLTSPAHKRRQIKEQLEWFDRHLFDTWDAPNEAFIPDSPLGRALKLADSARSAGFYGELLDGSLVPELVQVGDLLVGRFEVTRAQWEAWRTGLEAGEEPGTLDPVTDLGIDSTSTFSGKQLRELQPRRLMIDGNFPATGITTTEAESYCAWLGQLIGLEVRLPTEAEFDLLQGDAAGQENIFSWWAGYSPNLEDIHRLTAKVEELEVNRSLLLPVGSFGPAGDSGIYDLGGNAAEWVVTGEDERQVKAVGSWATALDDPLAHSPEPPAAYTGFRVVAANPAGSAE
jgi:dipeptidyl aminopeptidase/acylaminoacyl peptidase